MSLDQGPVSSKRLRRIFVLQTSYEVRETKIGFYRFAKFSLFVVNLRHIFRCRTTFSSQTVYNLLTMTATFEVILEAEKSVQRQECPPLHVLSK